MGPAMTKSRANSAASTTSSVCTVNSILSNEGNNRRPSRPMATRGRPVQSLFSDQYKDLLSVDFALPTNASQPELQKVKDQLKSLWDVDVGAAEEFYERQLQRVDALLAET